MLKRSALINLSKCCYNENNFLSIPNPRLVNDIRVRMVEYSPGYLADHWCSKGHIILCLEGEIETELKDGRIMKLTKDMCYFVGDDNEAHRTSAKNGCRLFIVD